MRLNSDKLYEVVFHTCRLLLIHRQQRMLTVRRRSKHRMPVISNAAIRQSMLCKPKRQNSYIHASKAIDIREEILDLITSTSRSARESELKTRIAEHLSGRVRPPGAATLPNMRISAGIPDTLAPNQKNVR